MSEVQAIPSAVAGDGRNAPILLSDPSKMGLKSNMDHTRWVNWARTNIKAPAQILKQSEGLNEGALEKIESAPILAL